MEPSAEPPAEELVFETEPEEREEYLTTPREGGPPDEQEEEGGPPELEERPEETPPALRRVPRTHEVARVPGLPELIDQNSELPQYPIITPRR